MAKTTTIDFARLGGLADTMADANASIQEFLSEFDAHVSTLRSGFTGEASQAVQMVMAQNQVTDSMIRDLTKDSIQWPTARFAR